MSTIILTTGVPGSGKSYVRCARFLYDDFLPNCSGVHYSNFPVNADFIASTLSKFRRFSLFSVFKHKPTLEEYKSRIKVIPEDVMLAWRHHDSGPWDYFKGVDLRYAHIALDEIHEICTADMPESCYNQWDEWLGTIRHRGCTIEGLTQDISLVSKCFTSRCSLRYELFPCEDLRDPFFGILLEDWYQLKASITGDYHKTVFVKEFMKQGSGKFKFTHSRRFLIDPFYFPMYNSYSKSLSE